MKLNHPFLIRSAARLVAGMIRFWYWILRVDYHVHSKTRNPCLDDFDEPYLFSVWHDSLMIPVILGSRRGSLAAALVSRHNDGSYLADCLEFLGLKAIRGSTSRGGSSALRQLISTAQDRHIFITPDGPRGPRRRMKPGIVFLASASGRPIIPTAFAASRRWRIKGSWTDLAIPQPFSTIYFLLGEPIEVPANLSREEIELYCDRVQQAMDVLNERAEKLVKASPGSRDVDETAQPETLSKAA